MLITCLDCAGGAIACMASSIAPKIPRLLGVVGAGQMGAGIAQTAAAKGVPVILADISQGSLDRGSATIHRSLARQVQKGQLTQEEAYLIKGRIRTDLSLKVLPSGPVLPALAPALKLTLTLPLQAVDKADFVIEAVSENEKIKQSIFEQLSQVRAVQQPPVAETHACHVFVFHITVDNLILNDTVQSLACCIRLQGRTQCWRPTQVQFPSPELQQRRRDLSKWCAFNSHGTQSLSTVLHLRQNVLCAF